MKYLLRVFFPLCICSALTAQQRAMPELFEKLKHVKDTEKVRVYFSIGRLYDLDDQFDSSLYFNQLALELAQKLKYERGVGNAYQNMGLTYFNRSDYETALALFLRALKIFEKNKLNRDASRTLMNIANVHTEQENYRLALEKLFEAIKLNEPVKDTITLIYVYSNIGRNYNLLKDFEKGRLYLEKGLTLTSAKMVNPYLSVSDSLVLANGYYLLKTSLGYALLEEGKYGQSVKIFGEVWEGVKNRKGVRDKAETLELLADSYNRYGKFDSALYYCNEALTLLKTDSIGESYRDIYQQKSIAYEGLGQYKDALDLFKKFKDLGDTILNAEGLAATAELQTRFETQKKDREIVQLSQKRRTQRTILFLTAGLAIVAIGFSILMFRSKKLQKKIFQQREDLLVKNAELESAALQKKMYELEQMALRAQMNPHFIFNSLNTVQHFFIANDLEGFNKYLGAFAHLVRQTLENSGKQLVTVEEEIKYVETYLSLEKMKSNDRFTYEIRVENEVASSGILIPSMILQPFVENSVRHGVSNRTDSAGHVKVLMKGGDGCTCLIDDNGPGRRKAAAMNPGKKNQEYRSRGMEITLSRIEAINKLYDTAISVHVSDLTDENKEIVGTRVSIFFPSGARSG